MLQPLAYHLVQSQEVVRGDAFAVGRVGDEDALLLGTGELLEGLQLQFHVLADAGRLQVAGGYLDGTGIVVVGVYPVGEVALAAVVVVDTFQQVGIEVGPLLEGIGLAEDTGRDVTGDESGFDGDGARTAHGVDEVALPAPACHEDDAGGQHFVEGGFHGLLTVAPAVERLAARVEREGAFGTRYVYVELHVGTGDTDAGTPSCPLAEVVGHGVLHTVGHELAVAELLAEHYGVYGEGLVRRQVVFPTDGFRLLVHFVRRLRREVLDGFQYTQGRAQAEVGTVHHLFVALEGHHAPAYLDVVRAEGGQLLCQHLFQALEGLGY